MPDQPHTGEPTRFFSFEHFDHATRARFRDLAKQSRWIAREGDEWTIAADSLDVLRARMRMVPRYEVWSIYASSVEFHHDEPDPASPPTTGEARVHPCDPGEHIWSCKIGGLTGPLPDGSDAPMRRAVEDAFVQVTGGTDEFCFSGWGATLTEDERECVDALEPASTTERHYIIHNTASTRSSAMQHKDETA